MKDEIIKDNIELEIILVEDEKIGGFTSFYKMFPNITSQGDTKDEAIENIRNTLLTVLNHKQYEKRNRKIN